MSRSRLPQVVRKVQCSTCIFRTNGKQLDIGPERMAEIQGYLIRGQPHTCHHEEASVIGKTLKRTEARSYQCRGARDFQLDFFHRGGFISAPTDQALEAAMREAGVVPAWLELPDTMNGESE